jgi:hypothetical protein
LDVNTRGGNLLSDLELVDVDVFDLSIKLIVLLCNNTNSLLIVTPDCRCTIELEIDASEESHLFLYLRASKGEREQFGFCSRFCDCALYS